jgi:hypothetical protein
MTKGTYKYIPKEMLEELNNTKMQLDIEQDADCFRVIARNNRLAKELRFNLNFKDMRKKK